MVDDSSMPRQEQAPSDVEQIVLPEDVASAGRSCSAVIVLFGVLLLLLCIGLAWRWAAIS